MHTPPVDLDLRFHTRSVKKKNKKERRDERRAHLDEQETNPDGLLRTGRNGSHDLDCWACTYQEMWIYALAIESR